MRQFKEWLNVNIWRGSRNLCPSKIVIIAIFHPLRSPLSYKCTSPIILLSPGGRCGFFEYSAWDKTSRHCLVFCANICFDRKMLIWGDNDTSLNEHRHSFCSRGYNNSHFTKQDCSVGLGQTYVLCLGRCLCCLSHASKSLLHIWNRFLLLSTQAGSPVSLCQRYQMLASHLTPEKRTAGTYCTHPHHHTFHMLFPLPGISSPSAPLCNLPPVLSTPRSRPYLLLFWFSALPLHKLPSQFHPASLCNLHTPEKWEWYLVSFVSSASKSESGIQ